MTTTAVGRDERGYFLPGNPIAKQGGRKPLPAWFRDGAEDCLMVLMACATGRARPDAPPAAHQVAAEATAKERLQAAEAVANRVLGKAPEMLEVGNASAVLDVLVALAKPVNQEPPEDP